MNIYVINLIHRTDRYQHIQNSFSKYNNIQLHFIEAVKHENGAIGCFRSHKKCIQLAKDNDMKNIIVIEDDCLPMEQFDTKLTTIKQYLDTHDDWDIFLGAVNKTRSKHVINKLYIDDIKLLQVSFGSTAHFIIYNHTSYSFFLECDENNYVDQCWSGKLKAFTCVPFLAKQINDFSDIENKKVNYQHTIDKTETLLELL